MGKYLTEIGIISQRLSLRFNTLYNIYGYFNRADEENFTVSTGTKIIHHWPLMHTEKSQLEGLPSFAHYPLTRGLGFSSLHRRTLYDYFSYLTH